MALETKGRLATAILLAMTASSVSAAQETGDGDGAGTNADSAGLIELDKVSITATRNPIKAFEYPGMVTVIGRDEVQVLQPSAISDVLKLVPNVAFTSGPRRTGEVPNIRGFTGPDVIAVIDGARQNFGSAHDGRFFIDPSLIKQAEVLRGPASALYGSGGTGGVIEVRTMSASDLLAPDEMYGGMVSGGYQNANKEYAASASAFGRPVEGLDLLGTVSIRNSGTIRLGNSVKLTNTDDDIIAGMAKANYALDDHQSIEGSFVTFNNDAREPNNGQGLGGSDSVDKDIRTNTFQAAYNYSDPGNNLIDLDLVGYYSSFQVDELRLDDLGAGPAGELLKRDVDTIGMRLDNRSRFDVTDSIGTVFTYGGEFYRDTQDGAAGGGERDGVPDADADFFGIYLQAEIAVTEALGFIPGDFLIIPGVRYDNFTTSSAIAGGTDESAVSPKIGVSYLPTDWLMTFVNYAHAFRAPTFDELFLTGTHFQIPVGLGVINRFVPNPDLKPQRTRTLEFGGGLTFDKLVEEDDAFQVKVSHFQIWGEDFIDLSVNQPTVFVDCSPFVPGACDGTTNSENIAEAELRGTEIEASYDHPRFLASFGFARIDGENVNTGEKLGVLTPDRFTVNTAIKLPEISAIVGWRGIFAREFTRVNSAAERRDAYDVHDFYFAWQPFDGVLSGLRIDLGIDNAFDEAYAHVFTDALEPGRNFKGLVSYSIKL